MLIMFSSSVFPCTQVLVGKNASIYGCPLISLCNDGSAYDFSLVKVPPRYHEPGEMRPLYRKPVENIRYPRIVDPDRSPEYAPIESQRYTVPVAFIPEVEYTHGYFELAHPILSDQGLGMATTDVGAITGGKSAGEDREDCPFENRNLGRIGMERCSTAREAIKLMGEMADKYGYDCCGSTMAVIDSEEAWSFQILRTPDLKGAIWVAQRVPDDEVAVMANSFTTREIDLSDPDYFMASENIFEIAKEQGWWDPAKEEFDFTRVYSAPRKSVPYGSLRRMWRAYDLLAPSKELSPWVEDDDLYTEQYPFSIKPDKKVSIQDLMAIHRDHMEGTEFDLTKGLAAGPFGSPNRLSGGSWERAISVPAVSHTFVIQSRGWLPPSIGAVCWFAHDCANNSCFVPFYAGITGMPKAYRTGSLANFTRESSWWAFDLVGQIADLRYCYMIEDIRKEQKRLEGMAFDKQEGVEKVTMDLYEKDPALADDYLTKYTTDHANYVVGEWYKLADYLIMKYNDGYNNIPKIGQPVRYPDWWLEEVSSE